MAEFPALPLWTDAYLADTAGLSAEQHGIYLIMLMIAWRRPKCSLPNDMHWLKHLLTAYCGNMHGNRFNNNVPLILARFWTLEEGEFVQNRLRIERDFLRKRSETNRHNSNIRWRSGGVTLSENNGLADAMAMPEKSDGNAPTPTPIPHLEESTLREGEKSPLNGSTNGHHSAETDYFHRGREVLGAKSGGMIAELLRAKGNVALARAAIELASTKANPREYVGAMIRKPKPESELTAEERREAQRKRDWEGIL